MDDHGLTAEVRQEPRHLLVTVTGEMDIATGPQLQERLATLAASGQPLIVDLNRVTFIDTSGLRVLANAARQAAQLGASLHAVCARHQVRRLFAITGLDRQIPLARTMTPIPAAGSHQRSGGTRDDYPEPGHPAEQRRAGRHPSRPADLSAAAGRRVAGRLPGTTRRPDGH
jgi:anti-sigma B factor antagonist